MISDDITMQTLRASTNWFIATDSVTIALTPRVRTPKPGGAADWIDGPVRVPQKFMLIAEPAFGGIVESGDGRQRQYNYVLVGEWDAAIEPGDWWVDSSGQHWEVIGMIPYNGYETKAGVHSIGKHPVD